MTNPKEDYTSRGWLVASATLLILFIVSLIPPISAGGIELRRASILSDLVRFDDGESKTESEPQPEINVAEFEVDLEAVAEQVAKTQALASPTGSATSASWEGIFEEQPSGGEEFVEDQEPLPSLEELPTTDYSAILPEASLITPIEIFAQGGMGAWDRLYEKLLWNKEQVRVAFMGDSFVEGDILTADLRELLQDTFHGGGVGFAPVASPFTGFRQTIKTTSKGWTPYNIMQRKSAPAPYADDFFVSGWVAKASAGASTRWDMTTKRRHLEEVERARLLFICRQRAEIGLKLNDGEERVFFFEGDEVVRQIVVEQEQIRSLEMTILSGAETFTGIGAEFDSKKGVAVDNFSIRSNNGQAMFWSNASVNSQINTMRPYDLVILQYGLNIMQAERHNYSLYGEQVEKMISYVESCFPGAAVLVMGVSDRSQKGEDGIKPMESAKSLTQSQREASQNKGVAFWDTYAAMQRMGGMTEFVTNGWAGKDYTHINYAGGARIARELYYAILKGAEEYCIKLRDRIERSKPILNKELEIAPIEHKPLVEDMLERDTIMIKPVE
ncbi:MAG: hypothetical protein IIU91_04490 [Alistipes sp.]|jgi:hypothetical protein|nr:hypothetical protein [Alistipes sp.]